ncbi:hypothetical protein [Chryseolinea serpens]|uniref:hypothetical protein n=1 Tax=Chryseolinea serpens TaxID=947013 RepID=UPI001160ED71|nr:hypothetical protein [Chryseolinea serpens]
MEPLEYWPIVLLGLVFTVTLLSEKGSVIRKVYAAVTVMMMILSVLIVGYMVVVGFQYAVNSEAPEPHRLRFAVSFIAVTLILMYFNRYFKEGR